MSRFSCTIFFSVNSLSAVLLACDSLVLRKNPGLYPDNPNTEPHQTKCYTSFFLNRYWLCQHLVAARHVNVNTAMSVIVMKDSMWWLRPFASMFP